MTSEVSGPSVEPLLPSKVAERRDIRQAEGKAVEIFVTDIGDVVTAILQGNAAAVPVVGGLSGGKLQLAVFRIEAQAGRGAESAPGQPAITESHAKLLESTRDLGCAGHGTAFALGYAGGRGLRNLQDCVAGT